jgi:hypothetical protein
MRFLMLAFYVSECLAQLRGFNITTNITSNSTLNSTLTTSSDYTNSYIAAGVLVPLMFLACCGCCNLGCHKRASSI